MPKSKPSSGNHSATSLSAGSDENRRMSPVNSRAT